MIGNRVAPKGSEEVKSHYAKLIEKCLMKKESIRVCNIERIELDREILQLLYVGKKEPSEVTQSSSQQTAKSMPNEHTDEEGDTQSSKQQPAESMPTEQTDEKGDTQRSSQQPAESNPIEQIDEKGDTQRSSQQPAENMPTEQTDEKGDTHRSNQPPGESNGDLPEKKKIEVEQALDLALSWNRAEIFEKFIRQSEFRLVVFALH